MCCVWWGERRGGVCLWGALCLCLCQYLCLYLSFAWPHDFLVSTDTDKVLSLESGILCLGSVPPLPPPPPFFSGSVCAPNRFGGPVGKGPPGAGPGDTRIDPSSLRSSHTSHCDIGTPLATCQRTGGTGSVLGLVDQASVYSDWVGWQVWTEAFVPVWLHVSKQAHP